MVSPIIILFRLLKKCNKSNIIKLGGNLTEELVGSKCKCGIVSVPAIELCSRCNSVPVPISFPSNGTILTYTKVHVTAASFEAPLGIALVELPDEIKLMCNFNADTSYNIGDEVKITMKENRWIIL